MAKPTVYISDHLLLQAREAWAREAGVWYEDVGTSELVRVALQKLALAPARPEASERGRLETLAALRAARAALEDLERTLQTMKPVKRHARRIR